MKFTFFFEMKTVALLMGIVYWKQQLDQKGIMNINGAIFILMINLTFMNIFSVINVNYLDFLFK